MAERLYCPWCLKPAAPPACPVCSARPLSGRFVAPREGRQFSGERLDDRYQVTRFIAEGGMGAVYMAYDCILQRMVAVKFLRTEKGHGRDTAAYQRFRQEAMLMVRLASSNTVVFLDFDGQYERAPYIVMELLEGRTLAEAILAGTPISLASVIAWFRPVCDVLAIAHGQGVVHRDIKPANIFLQRSPDGVEVVKVLDFGISRVADARRRRSLLGLGGAVYGTPHYMSPQQLEDERPSPADDLYALGCVLYEAMTGSPPFTGDTPDEVARKQVSVPAPRLVPGPQCPEELCELVADLLEKDPSARPASALEVRRRICALPARTSRRQPALPPASLPATRRVRGPRRP